MATTRERLQQMLDSVPDARLTDAVAALEPFADPFVIALLNAPDDDEEYTEDDLAAITETREELARGQTVPHEVVKRELGL